MGDRVDTDMLGSEEGLINPVGDHLGFLLRRCHAAVLERVTHEVRVFDLRPTEFTVLIAVRQNRHIRPSRLGEMLGIKLGNLSPLLDRLEDRGLLSRRRAADDQRAVELQITPLGRSVATKVTRAVDGHSAITENAMGHSDYAALIELLRKLLDILQPKPV